MNLSRFFTLAELTRSQTAEREGIPNQPTATETDALRALCGNVLDPLRAAVGQPIKVNSGYRGPALNRRIGGSTTSQHMQGKAADIQAPGIQVLELFKQVIRLGLPFDQLIYEAQNATTKWVHVSHNPGANRGEIRVAQFGPDGRPTGFPRVSAEQALAMVERVTRSGLGAAEMDYVERPDEPHDEPAPPAAAAPSPSTRGRRASSTVAAPAAPKAAAAKKVTARKAATRKPPAAKAAPTKAAAKKAPAAKKLPATKAPAKKAAAAKPRSRTAPAGSAAEPAKPARPAGSAPTRKAATKATAAAGTRSRRG